MCNLNVQFMCKSSFPISDFNPKAQKYGRLLDINSKFSITKICCYRDLK